MFLENTLIDTSDGFKEIKDLQRGDEINTLRGLKKLARLVKLPITNKNNFVKFPRECNGNVPTQDVTCLEVQLLVFDYKLVPASEFVNNVEFVEKVTIDNQEFMYNLLFEDQEYIHVNGLLFTSHHPSHPVHGLSHSEYFDPLKYRPGLFFEHAVTYKQVFNT